MHTAMPLFIPNLFASSGSALWLELTIHITVSCLWLCTNMVVCRRKQI